MCCILHNMENIHHNLCPSYSTPQLKQSRLVHQNGLAELSQSNKIYLLDTRNTSNYIWVDKFEPNSISEPSSNTNTPSTNTTITAPDSSKTTNVIIGTISGIVVAAALIIIGIFGFKWYQKRKQNKIMRIA
ncbi:15866_t:CDS:2, partial [Funneliformis caledonium]